MSDNKDMPAHPFIWDQRHNADFASEPGLTKLEHFTALAMQGFCLHYGHATHSPSELAERAVTIAEATLKALDGLETDSES